MYKKYKYKDYRLSIKETKERLEVDNNYSPYLMMKSFRNEEDVFRINQLNRYKNIDKQLHYDYLLHLHDT